MYGKKRERARVRLARNLFFMGVLRGCGVGEEGRGECGEYASAAMEGPGARRADAEDERSSMGESMSMVGMSV